MIPLHLDATSDWSLQRQICDQVRGAILSGTLRPNDVLPSSREFAQTLKISRKTVVLAYERLENEGYLTTRQGAGTFIAADLPETCIEPDLYASEASHRATSLPAQVNVAPTVKYPPVLERAGALSMVQHGPSELQYDFWYGGMNWRNFPLREWRQLLIENLSRTSMNISGYGPPEGIGELRQAIAEHVSKNRAIPAMADQVIITAGAQEGLNLISRLFVQQSTQIVVEDPCYAGAALAFLSFGASLVPVAVDEHGLRTDQLDGCNATLVYVTPSHQFPTGVTMNAARRLKLLHWAQSSGAYIVEDDYDSDFRYDGPPLAALAGLEGNSSVIYLGTFSKSVGSGLRTGYLIVPKQLIGPMRREKAIANYGHPWIEQILLADFINGGGFARHLRRIRNAYGKARTALLDSLTEHFGQVEILGAEAGMHVVWVLPAHFPNADEVAAIAASSGVGLYTLQAAGAYGSPNVQDCRALLLGYASLTPEAIHKGIALLAQTLERRGIQPLSNDRRRWFAQTSIRLDARSAI